MDGGANLQLHGWGILPSNHVLGRAERGSHGPHRPRSFLHGHSSLQCRAHPKPNHGGKLQSRIPSPNRNGRSVCTRTDLVLPNLEDQYYIPSPGELPWGLSCGSLSPQCYSDARICSVRLGFPTVLAEFEGQFLAVGPVGRHQDRSEGDSDKQAEDAEKHAEREQRE